MQTFHFHIHPVPAIGCVASGTAKFFGHTVTKWNAIDIERSTFEISFEQLENQLSSLPRMFFEMDGSFVWRGSSATVSETGSQPWQIDGMVYDVGGRVCRLELKGRAPSAPFAQVVKALQPASQLLAYCMDQSCFVNVDDILQVWDR